MNDISQNRKAQYVILFVFIALGAVAVLKWSPRASDYRSNKKLNDDPMSGIPESALLRDSTQEPFVQRYVIAYKTHNCAEVERCTLWIQDRLRVIEANAADADAASQERSALCDQLFSRDPGHATVSILGLDDQYLIPVTVTFTIDGADDGRNDLDTPIIERVWGVFVYSDPGSAPRDENGDPIHSLRAGLNISANGLAVKGSVRGNWEIDFDSISLQW